MSNPIGFESDDSGPQSVGGGQHSRDERADEPEDTLAHAEVRNFSNLCSLLRSMGAYDINAGKLRAVFPKPAKSEAEKWP